MDRVELHAGQTAYDDLRFRRKVHHHWPKVSDLFRGPGGLKNDDHVMTSKVLTQTQKGRTGSQTALATQNFSKESEVR